MISHEFIGHLLHTYGLWAVFVVVGLESIGIPLPGELILIVAATWASQHAGHIVPIILAAIAGAIVGDNIGYLIGRRFGIQLLLKQGFRIGMTEQHLKLGRYMFQKYGVFVVFFGRFVAVLRILAAFLAGANNLSWERFLIANAAGGILWATAVGLAAYSFGHALTYIHGPASVALFGIGVACVIAAYVYFKRHEKQLMETAERAYPDPIPGFRSSAAG